MPFSLLSATPIAGPDFIRCLFHFFQLHQEQVQILLDAFKNPPQTREEGIYFDDRQYKCVRADKNSIYGKCVSTVEKNECIRLM